MKKFQKKACIILTAAVVGLFALSGCSQSAQNQSSEQQSTQSSEQGQTSEQPSKEPTSSAEPSSPKEKITLDGVKDIIAKIDKPENIFDKIYQKYQYDKDFSNEMHEHFRYWLNEDHTEAINIYRYDNNLPCSVFHSTYDSQGQTTDSESLYKYEEKITLAAVKDIVSKSNPDTPWDVIFDIMGRYEHDESRNTTDAYATLHYWLNEEHTEAIIVICLNPYKSASVDYYVYDSEESLIKTEALHHYYIPETSQTDE